MDLSNDSLFEKIYDEYQQDIYRFSFWLCGNSDEAQDITAESFMRLWTAKSSLVAETVKGYLLTIARNIYLQKLRSKKNMVELDHQLTDPMPNLEAINESQTELISVINVLQKLPEIDRSVMIMKTYEGLSYQEISLLMGLSVPALKIKVHRARLKLVKNSIRGTSQ
jgi:RNA polymerase sigma-70 factor, ECF subfamily